MKKIACLYLFSCILLNVRGAEENLCSRFELMRNIEGTFTTGQHGRLLVPDDVFGKSYGFPNDLRIIGNNGSLWPCFLHIPKAAIETGILKPVILNKSFVSGREPYLQFDLAIPKSNGEKPVHNQIELVTSGHDFVRRVEVYTEQGKGLMAVGHLIDFPGNATRATA